MKTPFAPPSQEARDLVWVHRHLGDQNFREAGFLAWWYGLTAPADPAPGASFQERDLARRGRVASTILLCLALILPSVGFIGMVGPNKQIFVTALVVECIIGVCCWLNRGGRVNLVGILLGISVNFGMYMSLLRAPGGVSIEDKDIFYLLIFSELIIGAILPANVVLIAVIGNSIFAFVMLTFGPHTAALDTMLATSYWTILLRLLQIHAIPSAIVWSLAILARELSRRADRAEEVARLEHTIAQMKDEQAQKTAQLQEHMQQIVLTLNQVGQGHLQARVQPLEQHTTLWPLVGSMNTLLARYQRARQTELHRDSLHHAYHRLNEEILLVHAALQQAAHAGRPFQLPDLRELKPLFKHLDGTTLHHSPLHQTLD